MSKVAVFEYYPETSNIKIHLPNGEETEIEINPGWAFGKGDHPTTKLCIQALEKLFKNEQIETVLDVGCGSGVLSIASAALGAEYVVGVDIDNAITLEANSNIEKNGFSSKVKIVLGSFQDVPGEFDLVAANILIDSIVAISEDLKAKAKPSGTILLSGIKDEQKERAITKFNKLGYNLTEIYSEKEWVAMVFNQKA
ncbi:MAG: methyltransferase domain-containing protein [Nitrosopumilaceae archaeon]|nr:methyltransferase domain-containing protein [Nitrosopumilaceae archaeon]NIV66828.1 methyltransferase domain-containing protein [Nitrosopumilaceae archaeon]